MFRDKLGIGLKATPTAMRMLVLAAAMSVAWGSASGVESTIVLHDVTARQESNSDMMTVALAHITSWNTSARAWHCSTTMAMDGLTFTL